MSIPAKNTGSRRASFLESIPAAGFARLTVYDSSGRVVETLFNSFLPAGDHSSSWNPCADSASSGVYIVRLLTGNGSLSLKAVFTGP